MRISSLFAHPLRHRGVCALLAALVCAQAAALPSLDSPPTLRPGLPDEHSERGLRRERPDASEQAVAIAERRFQGRAVGARHVGNGVYRVRILQDDGKVKTVTVRPE